MTVWLIGGTQESAQLAQELVQLQIPCVVTVTTAPARSLYPVVPSLQIWVGRLNPQTIQEFIQTQSIHCILDASHPFAVDISQLAISTAQQHLLPYLRYERPVLPSPSPSSDNAPPPTPHSRDILPSATQTNAHALQTLSTPQPTPRLREYSSFQGLSLPTTNTLHSLFISQDLTGQRILLTLGYRLLHHFQSWHDRTTLFARILPSITALEAALNAGFTPDRLIALRPPISASLERALWQQWQISMVITKASGTAGGEDVKRQVAQELGVKLMVIDRPSVNYPCQTSDMTTAVQFCLQNPPPPDPTCLKS